MSGLRLQCFAGRDSVRRWRPSKGRKYWHVIKVDVIETAQSSTGVEMEVQRG